MSEENNKEHHPGKCSECKKRDYCKTQCRANKEALNRSVKAFIWRSMLRGFNDTKYE